MIRLSGAIQFSRSTGVFAAAAWRAASTVGYEAASDHIDRFKAIVGADYISKDEVDMEAYCVDWTRSYRGGSLICRPRSTAEVSAILKYCNQHRIGVVPQGGNTGLVGGAVGTQRGELILSLSRLNHVISVDKQAGTLTCEAGCILEALSNEVEQYGYVMPLDLGAKGSCMIGGNIATNAGGLRVVKYGSLQGSVLGLEVVQADGTVLNMLRALRKDNCGYPLKHLFIGSEGTLGIITAVCLQLAPKPQSSNVILAKTASFADMIHLLAVARRYLSENLTAFEFMDRNSIDALCRDAPHITSKIQEGILPQRNSTDEFGVKGVNGEVAVLIESTGSNRDLDEKRLEQFVERIVDEGLVVDAILSQSEEQERDLWKVREDVPVSLMQLSRGADPHHFYDNESDRILKGTRIRGKLLKYDLSVALQDTDDLLLQLKHGLLALGFKVKGYCGQRHEQQQQKLESRKSNFHEAHGACVLDICNFGHAADQNLHLNILTATTVQTMDISSDLAVEELTPMIQFVRSDDNVSISESSIDAFLTHIHRLVDVLVFDLTLQKKGSISAEHGVGQQKRDAMLSSARSPEEVQLMMAVKAACDSRNILNPGKVLIPQS